MDTKRTLTDQQIDAAFAEAARGMAPAEPPTIPMRDQIAPYRKKLLEYRKKGYSSEQLVKIMAHPTIGITVSASFLRKFLCPSGKKPKHALAAGQTATGLPPMPAAGVPSTTGR